MIHAALLLMLEAVPTDLVSPSASSAAPKIFSYPQAAGRLPHLLTHRGHRQDTSAVMHNATLLAENGKSRAKFPERSRKLFASHSLVTYCFDRARVPYGRRTCVR